MANEYLKLKERHAKDIEEFPMFFAFSDKQFLQGMTKLGLTVNDISQVCKTGMGGVIRNTDYDAFYEMLDRHRKEFEQATQDDTEEDGGFIYQMFAYELGNHEYGYTWDIYPTLEALGFTLEEVEANEKLSRGFEKAKKWYDDNHS